MSNLRAAAEALRQKGPKKTYEVVFEETETYTWRGEAIDEQDARDKAQNDFNDGNISSDGNNHAAIINTEEITAT